MTRDRYVPALGFHWLTSLYDPLIRSWSAATRMRASVIDALDLERPHRGEIVRIGLATHDDAGAREGHG